MAAYVIVEIETHDAELMARYRDAAKPVVESYGGRYLARGGQGWTRETDASHWIAARGTHDFAPAYWMSINPVMTAA